MPGQTDLETLAVRFEAHHKEFLGAVGQLDKRVAAFEKKTEKSTGRVAAAFKRMGLGIKGHLLAAGAGFAAYASARGVGQAVTANLDYLDSLDKVSSKLGVSTEFLQKAEYAASQSGIQMNTLTMSMQRFTRRAGEAAQGTGEARDAIRVLGIELRDSEERMRSSEALFTDAMAALARVDEPAERLRLAFKLFDSEGAVLVNLADNFVSLTEKAAELGLVVDENVIKTAVKAKDDLDTLARITKANLAPALVDLTPALAEISKQFVLISEYAAKAWKAFADFANLDTKGIEESRDRIGELKRDIAAWEGRMVRASEATKKAIRYRVASLRVDLEMEEAKLRAFLKRKEDEAKGPSAAPGIGAGEAGIVAPAERKKLMKAAEEWFDSLPTGDDMIREMRTRAAIASGTWKAPELGESSAAWRERMLADAGISPEQEEDTETRERLRAMTQQMGEDIREQTKTGLVEGIKSGQIDAKGALMGIGDSITTRFLETGVDDMMSGIQDGLDGVFEWAGPKLSEAFGGADFGPLTEKLGGAMSMAAGIGLSMIMRQLGGTRSRQTYADIQRASGITETEEVRGVISGPKEIAVAKIGGHIGDAMTDVMARPTDLLQRIADLVAAGLAELRGGGGGGIVDSEATLMLQGSVGLT